MKHLPKSTPTEILNDPYGFTYKEMSEVIGEDKARALYTELYKQPFHKKNRNYSAPKIPGIMQDFQQRQVLQLQRRLLHVFLLSRYKNGF